MRLVNYFPEFAAELSAALLNAGHPDLGRVFSQSTIRRCTHSAGANACYIDLEPSRPLSIVESEISDMRQVRTISVEHPFWVNVDVDRFGNPAGIELLSPSLPFVQRLLHFTQERKGPPSNGS